MPAGLHCFCVLFRVTHADCIVLVPDASGLSGQYRGRPGSFVYDTWGDVAYALELFSGITERTILSASRMS